MAEISKPDYTYLWSSGGSIVAPSNVKIQTGWTAEVPPFQWENWSQNRQDQAIAHVLQHGVAVWDTVTEYQAGKSYVQGSDGLLYKALQTQTNQNPVTDTTFVYWTKALSGGLLNVRTFTASGVYTPTPGTASVVVEVQGAGGGGGGVGAAPAASTAGPGGGAGGYGRRRITSSFAGVTITVGAPGGGGVGGNGGNGASSSFGSLLTANGGLGGSVGGTTTTTTITTGTPGQGGSTSLADVSRNGGAGGIGLIGPNFVLSGQGGASYFGAGAPYGSLTGTGVNDGVTASTNSGGGGSGAVGLDNGTQAAGGAGGSGIVIVWEYLA